MPADTFTLDGRRVAAVTGSTAFHLVGDDGLTGCAERPARLLEAGDMTQYDDALCAGCDAAFPAP